MPKRLSDEQRGPLGARLYHARLDAGFEQKEIAEKIGIATVSYTKWETGKTDRPDIGHLKKAAELLNVDLPWLLTGEQTVSSDALNALRKELSEVSRQLEELKQSLPQPE